MKQKVLLISLENDIFKVEAKKAIGADAEILVSSPDTEAVYINTKKCRPRFVFIDTSIGQKLLEQAYRQTEEVKWNFDIELDIVLIGKEADKSLP